MEMEGDGVGPIFYFNFFNNKLFFITKICNL